VTIRPLATVCLACNREPGVPMCPMCSALEDAEQDAARQRTPLTAETRRQIREARDAESRRRMAASRAQETNREREARRSDDASASPIAAEHVPPLTERELAELTQVDVTPPAREDG
jgi:hypothetical protein